MFDNLRQKSAEEAAFLNEEPAAPAPRPPRRASLGLTPLQRFVLALFLFLNVAVLGFFALVVFEKIWLPF
jgi:hypothetical protein